MKANKRKGMRTVRTNWRWTRWGLVLGWVALVMLSGCERDELDLDALGAEAGESSGGGIHRMDQYRTRVQGTELEVGQEGEVMFQVVPGPDLKINLEFPWRMQWESPEGVVLKETEFDAATMDLTEEVATIAVPLEVLEAGSHEVRGIANFSVCNDDRCDILQREEVSFVIDAE